MKRFFCILLCLFTVTALCACNKKDSGSEYSLLGDYEKSDSVPQYNFMSGEIEVTESYMAYAEGLMDFSFRLLSENADTEENVVLSPISVSNVLSLLANGAEGNTQKEIRQVVAKSNMDLINSSAHYLNSRISAFNSEQGYFNTADSVWFADSFDVKSSFLQTAVNYYNAAVMRVSMGDPNTTNVINQWISQNTAGRINDAVDIIDPSTLAIAVNAVLMNDSWATTYTDGQLSEGTFHGATGDTEATFMNSQEHYVSTPYAEGFIKGFANLPLKFAAIMPVEGVSVTEFAEEFTAARWQALLDSQQATAFCRASLPQFSYQTKTDLKAGLENMGIVKAFDAKTADFSGISNTGDPYLDKITQDAFIEIGPQGAKAGAATVVIVAPGSAAVEQEEIPRIVFDKPFVFVIYDNESGIPVFTGIVNNVEG